MKHDMKPSGNGGLFLCFVVPDEMKTISADTGA
jgi:hypothetical protein